jgi:hypothetical protein
MVVKWIFEDASVPETYTFAVNPVQNDFSLQKSLIQQKTLAPDGQTILFEGRDEPRKFSFDGTLLEADQHDKFVEWFEKRRQIKVTDDLGAETLIYITNYTTQRGWRQSHPNRRTYTVDAVVVQE